MNHKPLPATIPKFKKPWKHKDICNSFGEICPELRLSWCLVFIYPPSCKYKFCCKNNNTFDHRMLPQTLYDVSKSKKFWIPNTHSLMASNNLAVDLKTDMKKRKQHKPTLPHPLCEGRLGKGGSRGGVSPLILLVLDAFNKYTAYVTNECHSNI